MRVLVVFAAMLFSSMSAAQQDVSFGSCDIVIETGSGPVRYNSEFAYTPAQAARGLMFRKEMAPRTGMLFHFGQERVVSMWMKNTYLPLDMVFLSAAGKITHIHRNAVPQSIENISSQMPALFVLELNAGEADRDGLEIGQTMNATCRK